MCAARVLQAAPVSCRRVSAPVDQSFLEGTFDHLYGLRITAVSPDEVCGEVVIGPQHLQPAGLVHGGVLLAMAESLTSMATHAAVMADGQAAIGMSQQTTFMRPFRHGTISARGLPRHRGRSTWIWDVEFTDDAERVCALSRVTVAVRPMPDSQPR
jgi:1,4-dihydroxy-2-naphthoyl-CoA hydrolase